MGEILDTGFRIIWAGKLAICSSVRLCQCVVRRSWLLAAVGNPAQMGSLSALSGIILYSVKGVGLKEQKLAKFGNVSFWHVKSYRFRTTMPFS